MRDAVAQLGLTAKDCCLANCTFESAIDGAPVTPSVRISFECALARATGAFGVPTHEQILALAAAVIMQAKEDLLSEDRDVREEAHTFLEVSLWLPDCPWARILGVRKHSFVAALAKTMKREFEERCAEDQRQREFPVPRHQRVAFQPAVEVVAEPELVAVAQIVTVEFDTSRTSQPPLEFSPTVVAQ